jgi:hypothetical protein
VVGSNREQLVAQPACRDQHDTSAGRSAACTTAAHAIGRDVGMAELDSDVLDPGAEPLRRTLGQRRLVALS